jgi:hypothetical protein
MMQRWLGAEVCATKQNLLTPALHPVNELLGNEKERDLGSSYQLLVQTKQLLHWIVAKAWMNF